MDSYFETEELLQLKAVENKTLARVFYHLWQNKIDPQETFEFLDKLEMVFTDDTRIFLGANEDLVPGIIVVKDFDAEKNRLMLLHEFQGKIDYATAELTGNGLWALMVGKKLKKVGVIDEGDNCYLNDAVLLDFGTDKMEIHPGVEGLIVEPYEEV
ncbi:hypothetical protein BH09BAC5_BH09BAC5_28080 [soil metagenome]